MEDLSYMSHRMTTTVKVPRPGPLAIRLSPDERAHLQHAADQKKVPLSTYIKSSATARSRCVGAVRTFCEARGLNENDTLTLLRLAELL